MMPPSEQTGAVLGVLTLLAATLWGLRRGIAAGPPVQWLAQWRARLGRPAAGAPLRVRAQLALTPQHRLHEIQTAGGECYLLATHPGGVTVIAAAGIPGESRPPANWRAEAHTAGHGS